MITDLRTISNFFFTHIKFVTNLSLFEGSRRTPKSNLWTTPKMGFVRDEMNKHYELNRGVRRLLTRCGLHKFHWSWWGWFNFSCTKRERTNDWAKKQYASWWSENAKNIFFRMCEKSESSDINVQQYSTPVLWKHPIVFKDGLGNFVILWSNIGWSYTKAFYVSTRSIVTGLYETGA